MTTTKLFQILNFVNCLFGWKETLTGSEAEWPSLALDLGREVESIAEEREEHH